MLHSWSILLVGLAYLGIVPCLSIRLKLVAFVAVGLFVVFGMFGG